MAARGAKKKTAMKQIGKKPMSTLRGGDAWGSADSPSLMKPTPTVPSHKDAGKG